MVLIGLCGPDGVGKTSVAKAMLELMPGRRLSFASPLKLMLQTMLFEAGFTTVDAHAVLYGAEKDKPLDVLDGKSARHAMRTLGTEWGRDLITPNLWVNITERTIQHWADETGLIVLDDVRFPSEVEMIKRLGGKVYELYRYGITHSDDHRSNAGMPGMPIINNTEPGRAAAEIMSYE